MLAGQLALILFSPLMMAYWYAPVLVVARLFGSEIVIFQLLSLVPGIGAHCGLCRDSFDLWLVCANLAGEYVELFFRKRRRYVFRRIDLADRVLVLLPTLYASFYVSYRDIFVTIDDDA